MALDILHLLGGFTDRPRHILRSLHGRADRAGFLPPLPRQGKGPGHRRLGWHRMKLPKATDSACKRQTPSWKQELKKHTDDTIHQYIAAASSANRPMYTHLYEMMTSTRPEGAAAAHRGRAERRNHLPILTSIRVPTLIIVGEEDYFTPLPHSPAYKRQYTRRGACLHTRDRASSEYGEAGCFQPPPLYFFETKRSLIKNRRLLTEYPALGLRLY